MRKVRFDVDGVGYAASVLEGCMRGAVDEAHCLEDGEFFRYWERLV